MMANQKAHIEWDLVQTTEWIMEELKWRVIDNRLKDMPMSPHDALVLEIERGKRRDRLYAGVVKLLHSVPEPVEEDKRCMAGIEEEETFRVQLSFSILFDPGLNILIQSPGL
jgi:hypothetical protein